MGHEASYAWERPTRVMRSAFFLSNLQDDARGQDVLIREKIMLRQHPLPLPLDGFKPWLKPIEESVKHGRMYD